MRKTLLAISFVLGMFSMVLAQQNYNLTLRSNLPYPEGLSSLWGYTAPNGTEYAIVGTTTRVSIVSLANPNAPVEVASVPGPNTIWREMKVWGDYAYVSLDNVNVGLLIINLANLPSVTYQYWTPSVTSNGVTDNIESIHTVTMDENGIMYLNGTNVNNGEPLIFDVNTNPGNPIYLGSVGNEYCHDSYARGDTIYLSNIYAGHFVVWDVSDKSNPVQLASQVTPSNFTHNSWLTDDSQFLFTTDEVADAWVTAYDISDLNNITEVDRWHSMDFPNTGVVPHNVHVLNDFVVTAHYTDGVKIVDGHRPDLMVEVGSYDTYPAQGGSFDGCWGVYPYYNSGIIIASDREYGLYVLQPNYVRACYLEGTVTDANTGLPINGALCRFANNANLSATTNITGDYSMGLSTAGTYDIIFSKSGYITDTLQAILVNGQVTILDAALIPATIISMTGTVIRSDNGQPIPNAKLHFFNLLDDFNTTSDANGNFTINNFVQGNYTVHAGKWGFHTRELALPVLNPGPYSIVLDPGYRDEFALDLGWTTSGNANTGMWERGEPAGTDDNGTPCQTDLDVQFDISDLCFATGLLGGGIGADDVDGGDVVLNSPAFDLTGYTNPYVRYYYWFQNTGGNGNPNDTFNVYLQNGVTTVNVQSTTTPQGSWRGPITLRVSDFLTPTSNMHLRFRTADTPTGHVVEGAVDYVEIFDSLIISVNPIVANGWTMNISPNPSAGTSYLSWESDAPVRNGYAEVYSMLGVLLSRTPLQDNASSGNVALENNLPKGMYTVRIVADGEVLPSMKWVVQ